MIAYKGFNHDLTCHLGHGVYKYKVGETYIEGKAQCASTGFHCVEEPIEVLSWYSAGNSRYCMVDARGDIHEDGHRKLSCTEMEILQELTLEQIGALECEWIMEHPKREYSPHVTEEAKAFEGGIAVARGKNPCAKGELGSTIFILREDPRGVDIVEAGAYRIDGKKFKPGIYYGADGRAVRCKKVS